VENKLTNLAAYIWEVLKERNLSIRAFATYSHLTHPTIRRILAGKTLDHATFKKLATYLNMPVETLYRMAGVFPPAETEGQEEIRVIEHLAASLPKPDQQEIIQIMRMKIERLQREQQ
jgi:transcriptional regulator with XRE-family HTH domain